MAPPLQTPCRIQKQFQRKYFYFLEIIMFLGQKIDKVGTDSKL